MFKMLFGGRKGCNSAMAGLTKMARLSRFNLDF